MWAEKSIDRILFSEEEIITRTKEIGAKITEDYKDEPPLLVALLRGSVPFMAELLKAIDLDIQYDFMDVSSYVGTNSVGDIRILKDLDSSVTDKHVLIIEDIVDTGNTINSIKKTLFHRGAKSVKVVTLLDKPARRAYRDIQAEYVGFEVGDEFVIGYGMDFDQKYRCLPFIGVLKKECYETE